MKNTTQNPSDLFVFLCSGDSTFIIPSALSQKRVLAALPENFSTAPGNRTSHTMYIYDTFDMRLRSSGQYLLKQQDHFFLFETKSRSITATSKSMGKQYFFYNDFEPELCSIIKPKVDVRALYHRFTIKTRLTSVRILNPDEKTVLIWHFINVRVPVGGAAKVFKLLQTQSIRGYAHLKRSISERLAREKISETASNLFDFCFDLSRLAPVPKFKVMLNENDPTWIAVQKILQTLSGMIQSNREGILKNIDTEFLHDFRVAMRRTRTAIGQIKGVLPSAERQHFKGEFKTLQQRTNRLRDLDVYLLNRSDYETLLPVSLRPGLDPFFETLNQNRQNEFRKVCRSLDSAKYENLMRRWDRFLNKDWQRQDNLTTQNSPIKSTSDQLLRKKLNKILKDGARITKSSPIDEIHDLRIQFKNLRYLFEFFRSLYPDSMKQLITHFKAFQDYLGRLNDLSIQQEHILTFLQGTGRGKDQRQMIAALGGLVAVLSHEFETAHSQFKVRFQDFSSRMKESFHF